MVRGRFMVVLWLEIRHVVDYIAAILITNHFVLKCNQLQLITVDFEYNIKVQLF